MPSSILATLGLSGSYSLLLDRKTQSTPSSPVVDVLGNPLYGTDARSRVNVAVDWSLGRFSTTLYVDRLGRTPNYAASSFGLDSAGAGYVSAWTRANLGLSCRITRNIGVSANVDNLFDAGPPADHSYPGYSNEPFNVANYDVTGRSFLLSVSVGL